VGAAWPSTPGASLSAAASTRHTQPGRAAHLHRCVPSTGSTPPTTTTRSLNSAIQPRVPTRPTGPLGDQNRFTDPGWPHRTRTL